jgi:ER lumen protein retaining receptor
MDIFQLIGDFLHLVAILLLLLKIVATKNVVGLSYKTQEIYLIVFLTRYSDLILGSHWGSIYFNVMRFIFIGVNALTIHYMKNKRPYKLVDVS